MKSKVKGKGKPKTLNCKECNDPVHNCGSESVSVTCSACVMKSMSIQTEDSE